MRLIINIPAFNEEEKITSTIKNLPRLFHGINEVLVQVINDGSTDKTVQVSKNAGADFVYSNDGNRGLGITFRHACIRALENGADIMVNIDADGQFNPNDIAKLIQPILDKKADMVVADRFSDHKADNIPWIKDFLNRVAAKIVSSFMNAPISDLTCGFRAHNRETLLRLNLPGGFTYTQETIIDALGKNLKIVWVPVHVQYFKDRKSRIVKSIYGFVSNSAKIIIRAVRDVRPMKFFGIPGLILIMTGLMSFFYFLFLYFEDFKISPFRNLLIFSISIFLIGLQFLIFALIADMIKNTRKLTEDMMYQLRKEHFKK